MNWTERVRKQGAARRREERVKGMKDERWYAVRVVGIAPYTIDKAYGFYLVEFHPKTGRTLPFSEQYKVPVVAFDLRYPEGKVVRYSTLREARAAAALMAAERRQGGA